MIWPSINTGTREKKIINSVRKNMKDQFHSEKKNHIPRYYRAIRNSVCCQPWVWVVFIGFRMISCKKWLRTHSESYIISMNSTNLVYTIMKCNSNWILTFKKYLRTAIVEGQNMLNKETRIYSKNNRNPNRRNNTGFSFLWSLKNRSWKYLVPGQGHVYVKTRMLSPHLQKYGLILYWSSHLKCWSNASNHSLLPCSTPKRSSITVSDI